MSSRQGLLNDHDRRLIRDFLCDLDSSRKEQTRIAS
jgi:hypothetical protein